MLCSGQKEGVFGMVFNRDEYDERQVLARGRAFMWGFFTLMICLMAVSYTHLLWEQY